MAIYTTSLDFAAAVLPREVVPHMEPMGMLDPKLAPLIQAMFPGNPAIHTTASDLIPRGHLLLSEFAASSQYDRLVDLARNGVALPDRVACLAGSGLDFHGFKGRPWAAIPGNLHLVVHLAPDRPVDRFHVAFTVLAALSVVETVDAIPGLAGRAGLKWVNDVLVEGAKVAGVLAHTQSRGEVVTSAVLGIGLNVEATPLVEPTPFVPRAASLRDFLPPGGQDLRALALLGLLHALDRNYRVLLDHGFEPLLARYRHRSLIMGEEVVVCTEVSDHTLRVMAEGVVRGLGDSLELFLEGRDEPLTGGRLILGTRGGDLAQWTSTAEDGCLVRSS
jgi:BirA family transcriptional regulator, biotin operon repressor / biotin---[acetyl-CoA-carboxylase] ligase